MHLTFTPKYPEASGTKNWELTKEVTEVQTDFHIVWLMCFFNIGQIIY